MRGITIRIYDRKTEVRFKRSINNDLDKVMEKAKEQTGFRGNFALLKPKRNEKYSIIQTRTYRINVRLHKHEKYRLYKSLHDITGLKEPSKPDIINKASKPIRKRSKTDTGIICGFIGNLVFGDLEFIYN